VVELPGNLHIHLLRAERYTGHADEDGHRWGDDDDSRWAGRPIRVARGDTSGIYSWTDTVYEPCACSPLGKIQKVSPALPAERHADLDDVQLRRIGRTLSVQQPDGASATWYAYSGNQATVTDPAGKWKQFTSDVLGIW